MDYGMLAMADLGFTPNHGDLKDKQPKFLKIQLTRLTMVKHLQRIYWKQFYRWHHNKRSYRCSNIFVVIR